MKSTSAIKRPIIDFWLERRAQVAALGLILTILLCSGSRAAASASYSIAPPPPWVDVVSVQPAPKDGLKDIGRGTTFLLIDSQYRVSAKGVERYLHEAEQVLSPAALEDVSQLQFDFEPSYQKLIIHHVRLLRGSQTIDALKQSEISVIQQESELDQRLFNGTLSALIILKDVRAGDVIDYSYSLVGDNPILGGRYADTFMLADSQTVDRLRCRLLWPAGRQLFYRNQKTDLQPAIRKIGGETEYVWERQNIAAVDYDDSVPAWFNPYPRVQLSEFGTWGEVVRWAEPLYGNAGSISPDLKAQIDQWKSASEDAQQRLLSALRFVQDEVRYLGIELGPHSHLPHQPSQVFRSRFGDCKDKTFLLTTILNSMGIEAYPALVNTRVQRLLDEWQPSPFAFDHVIVRASLAGRTYWIDPTINLQRGQLGQTAPLDYARALVIKDGSNTLEKIPFPLPGKPTTSCLEVYTIERYDAEARLDVVTTYRQEDADAMRSWLAQHPLSEVSKSYLNYHAGLDPNIAADGEPQVNDNAADNILVVSEKYRVPHFWLDNKRKFYASRIGDELTKPNITRRTTPLAIPHPVDIEQTIEIRLPEAFDLDTDAGRISDSGLRFDYRYGSSGKTIRLYYHLQSLSDSVPADQVASYLHTIDEIDGHTSYQISRGTQGSLKPRWWVTMLVVLLVFGPLLAALVRMRIKSRRESARRRQYALTQQPLPGSSPETALRAPADEDFTRHLSRYRCGCGLPYYQPGHALQQQRMVFDGRKLLVVLFECAKCKKTQDVYFDLSQPNLSDPGLVGEEGRP